MRSISWILFELNFSKLDIKVSAFGPECPMQYCAILSKFLKACKIFLKDDEHWPRGYKTFFMLNSAEHENYPANKC